MQFAFGNLHNGIMLYNAVCHANLQSVICYPYPHRIHGIVENDIRIYLYPQKFTDIRKYLSTVPYPRTSGMYCMSILDVDDLKQHLIAAWSGLEQRVINEAIDQWHGQLHASVS